MDINKDRIIAVFFSLIAFAERFFKGAGAIVSTLADSEAIEIAFESLFSSTITLDMSVESIKCYINMKF